MPQNRARESNHSLGGPCIHPDPAAAEVRAGEGPRVGKENVGNGNSLTHAPKLNPEVAARVYCVGRLESKMVWDESWSAPSNIRGSETVWVGTHRICSLGSMG